MELNNSLSPPATNNLHGLSCFGLQALQAQRLQDAAQLKTLAAENDKLKVRLA